MKLKKCKNKWFKNKKYYEKYYEKYVLKNNLNIYYYFN